MNITLPEDSQQLLSSEVYIGIAILLTIVPVVGFFENAVVILVFFKNRHLRKSCNLYITGLAICDVLHCTIGMPMVTVSGYARGWIFQQKGCAYYGFVTTFLGITQITILTVIAVDRYKTMRAKYVSKCKSDMKRCVLILLACYCHGFIWAIFPLAGWSSFQIDDARLSCCISFASKAPLDISYLICLTFFGYIIPVVCITSSYCGIHHVMRKNSSKVFRNRNSSTEKMFSLETSITITVFFMIVCFLISWTPYAIVSIVTALMNPKSIPTFGKTLPGIFAKCSAIWNPIVYVIRNSEFRESLTLTLFRIPCHTQIKTRSIGTNSNFTSGDARVKHLSSSIESIPSKPLNGQGIFTITCLEDIPCLTKTFQNQSVSYR
ncbi:hypothetical protein CHS0354_004542 [Potamilus streckersoni]|uniref:G-protein coupled receptors family 1 profile domain-containing protein n=1 Tax=Potamilus streckersoni TaxID=2493646 RepID=A0AAE0S651_9BIVA|nr:hypothetical protein CHS0354_004542 [Potamilus streckersoni]